MNDAKNMFGHNFIEYASYVIKDRAIPDLDDGLKPVQRRILHVMNEIDDGRFNKVANIVGSTMQYHPHGDASIYSALVTLANKELFIDRQGNFGNIYTGDEASAARYIEARLNSLAKEVLYNKDLTEYVDSYDGRNKEPVILPAKIPVLLLLGCEGIAVGMSTKILPHNFNELLEAQIKILKGEKITIYPDFIQGGIMDIADYQDGNGKVKIRAKIDIQDDKTLLIRDIPFGLTTDTLITSIEDATKKDRLGIISIKDFTAENVCIEIKVGRGESAKETLKTLYACTKCEMSLSVNVVVINDNKPSEMNITDILRHNTKRLVFLLEKELNIEKVKLNQRLHDLTLEQIFIENRIYKKIEEKTTFEDVINTVETEMNKYKKLFIRELIREDIDKLLEIKIKRISRFDIENYKKTRDDIVTNIKQIDINLMDIRRYTITYITNLIKKYGKSYPRKTKIEKFEKISVKEVALPDIRVYWDKNSGFFGTDVRGDKYFTVSKFDKFLIVKANGVYKVINIDSKVFIDTDVLYLDLFNDKKEFSLLYKDTLTNIVYAKKFKIEKFLTNKEYNLFPLNNGKVEYLSNNFSDEIVIQYKKTPKQKLDKEKFSFKNVEEKKPLVKGVIVTKKEIVNIESL